MAGGEYGVWRVERGCEVAAAGWTSGGGRSAMAAAARDGREAGETEKAKPAARGQERYMIGGPRGFP